MKFSGFVGPTYTLKSVNVDCQRCVNLVPEVIESGNGKEGARIYYKGTPGLEWLFNVGSGPIRLIARVPVIPEIPAYPPNRFLVVSGNKAYAVTYDAGVWSSVQLMTPDVEPTEFTLNSASGPVSAKFSKYSFQIPGESGPIDVQGVSGYFADGSGLYGYSSFVLDGVLTESCQVLGDIKASHVEAIDGYFIINEVGTSRFYVSDWNSPNFDPLSFASAEGDPDNINAILAKNRELWLFNENSTEVFYNSGNADFPFERVQGGFIEKGCLAPYSTAKIDGFAFWLGRDYSGQGIVYMAQGLTPQRISTHAVEQAIATYANPSKASAYTYQSEGHSYYVLNFAEGTWVYDLSTQLWHERAYTDAGNLVRHRADNHAFYQEEGFHLVGDFETNKVYALDENVYTDNENPITRLRRSPHVSGSLNRVFHKRFILDMETGVGLDGDVQGSDPQVMMRFSNDGGHAWSSEAWVSAGKKIGGIGDFKKRVIWNRLGSARDRVYEIKITDPVRVTIIGAELDLEVGNS